MSQSQSPPLPPPPRQPFRLPPQFKIPAWVFGSLIILALLAWIITAIVAESMLDSTLAKLKQDGYATTLEEFAPATTGDEATAGSLFARACSGQKKIDINNWFGSDWTRRYSTFTPEEKKKVDERIEVSAQSIKTLDKARSRPPSAVPRDYSKGVNIPLPEIHLSAVLSRSLNMRARKAVSEGRHDNAREDVRRILYIARAHREEPFLMCQGVRVHFVITAMETLQTCVTRTTPADELHAWRDVVPDPKILNDLAERGLRGELAWSTNLIAHPDRVNLDRSFIQEFSGGSSLSSDPTMLEGLDRQAPGVVAYPFWKISGARHLERMRRMVDASTKPYVQARSEMRAIRGEVKDENLLDRVSSLLLPSMDIVIDRQVEAQATLLVVRTGLDFEIEQAEKGAYPAEVKTLDPFTGKPLMLDTGKGEIWSTGRPGVHTRKGEAPPVPTWKLRQAAPK